MKHSDRLAELEAENVQLRRVIYENALYKKGFDDGRRYQAEAEAALHDRHRQRLFDVGQEMNIAIAILAGAVVAGGQGKAVVDSVVEKSIADIYQKIAQISMIAERAYNEGVVVEIGNHSWVLELLAIAKDFCTNPDDNGARLRAYIGSLDNVLSVVNDMRSTRHRKSDTEYNAAVLAAVAQHDTLKDAFVSLMTAYPDRVGQHFTSKGYRAFQKHVERLRSKQIAT